MPDAHTTDFRIYPGWKDVMVYDEGDDRQLRFDCGSLGGDAFEVTVPTVEIWNQETPAWAHEKRNLILARLRAARCNLREAGQFVRTLYSPAGRFRVEIYSEPDPPFPPQEEIRVLGDQGLVVRFPGAGVAGLISFPTPGAVTIPFNVRAQHFCVDINVDDRTFQFQPDEQPRPLGELPELLATQTAPRPAIAAKPRFPLAVLWEFPTCVIFVAAGIWQALDGKTTRDQVLGALCVVLFGACFLVPISEWRRWKQPVTMYREDDTEA